ncbi:MAG: hypothetical protein AVDCRST_MAG70-511 [uncultured Thermomicrobiales bacterium]|uniref:Uncharacterized protein n=1 Tax=uncultured Thermomicrobiales bacterium TaxID=1645740 RepID=A0A6J4UBH5_9BACT|nr:MAG: hypothetical protein AVDCRST_MAG70-511 [uncultured Thermomicrobiales bacterium]
MSLPKGPNKRGVVGIHVMFTTSQEARFDGATGTIVGTNSSGPYGTPLYHVDFRGHTNRVAVPWQSHWFRETWIVRGDEPAPAAATADATGGSAKSASGQGSTTVRGSS